MRSINYLLFMILWSHLPDNRRDHLRGNLELLNRMHAGRGESGHCLILDDRSIITVGPRLARRLGYKPTEMIGKNIYSFILARDHVLMFAFTRSRIAKAYITLQMKAVQNGMRVTFSIFRLDGQIYLHALHFAQQGYARHRPHTLALAC